MTKHGKPCEDSGNAADARLSSFLRVLAPAVWVCSSDTDEASGVAEDDVILQRHLNRATGGHQIDGDLDIGGGWRGIPGRMVMYRDGGHRARNQGRATERTWWRIGAIDIATGDLTRCADQA